MKPNIKPTPENDPVLRDFYNRLQPHYPMITEQGTLTLVTVEYELKQRGQVVKLGMVPIFHLRATADVKKELPPRTIKGSFHILSETPTGRSKYRPHQGKKEQERRHVRS